MKALVAFAALPVLLAAPAIAGQYGGQHTGYDQSYGQGSYDQQPYSYGGRSDGADYGGGRYGQGGYYGRRYDYSYGGQQDVPGDYRCDAYWDRGRSDCNADWRDPRGYGDRSRYGYGQGYSGGRTYYSSQSGRGYGRGTTYYGAYGQPDVVYAVPTGGYGPSYGGHPGGGHGHNSYGGRNQGRIEWCRATYRSYDVRSGYYRAYSGRLVYCG